MLSDVQNSFILMQGTHFPFSACQRGLVTLPVQMHHEKSELSNYTELPCILDLYLNIILPKVMYEVFPLKKGSWPSRKSICIFCESECVLSEV